MINLNHRPRVKVFRKRYSLTANPLPFVEDLNLILMEKMEQEIPVITVVPVIGTTEEGAVDPLVEILALRDDFRKQVSRRVLYLP